ncbi:MAG: TetR/AcrR family transcriptional regulator [Lachnospiraceae bacterium]|nr:TetR/AcrR family transcriptional regulator [Lachnospiraceae bacterium]
MKTDIRNVVSIREEKAVDDKKVNNLRESILEGTLQVFNQNGLKFTMDDIASLLKISKKTIYTVFRDKEELFLAMVDCLFDQIKEEEREVLENESLCTVEKIRVILGVLPDRYRDVDFRQLYTLKEKYPKIYRQVELRLETGWEATIALIEQGMREGCIKPVRIPILKMMLEAALEQFFQKDILIQNGVSYQDALDEVVDILMEGITLHREAEA